MPTPTDTHELLRSLEAIAEAVDQLYKSARSLADEIEASGVRRISPQFPDAAIRAGMPRSRAYDYAEEYAATGDLAAKRLGEILPLIGDVKINIDVLTHIARVVPHRCPGSPKTLLLTR
jgi:hypothetical protein